MDVKMKKNVKGLVVVMMMMGCFIAGVNHEKTQDSKKVIVASQMASDGEVQVTYSDGSSETFYMDSVAGKKVEIQEVLRETSEKFVLDDSEIGVILTDGSWASIDQEKNVYEFQPIEMGDWSYNFDSLEKLENAMKTYMEGKNENCYKTRHSEYK